jgi:nitroimidazol reductase NimA-like FMN-containing flavoprotein (pyridoxamine 5'-phosphate oxidase superfamily)
MTRAEREEYLADLHVGVLSISSDDDRGPLTAPIWYGYEPGGLLFFTTYAESRKGRLLAEGKRISLCAQTEENPYRYVSVEGPVVSIAAADLERDERTLAHRYLGKEGGDQFIAFNEAEREANESIVVRMRPERWLTVD